MGMRLSTQRSSAAVSTIWPAPTIALYYLEDRRGADGPGRLEPERGLRYHPAHGLFYGAVLQGRVDRCQMHPVCCHDPLCYPQARAALPAPPEAHLEPSVALGRQP